MNKRYLAGWVGGAVAAMLQVASGGAAAAHVDVAPMPQAVIDAVVNKQPSPKAVLADQVSQVLQQMDAVLARHDKGPVKGLTEVQRTAYLRLARADIEAQQAMLPGLRQALTQAFRDKGRAEGVQRDVDRLSKALERAARADQVAEMQRAVQDVRGIVRQNLARNELGVAEPLNLGGGPTVSQPTPLKFLGASVRPASRMPAYTQYGNDGQPVVALAAAGNAVLLPTPTEATSCAYNPGDLDKAAQEEVNSIKYPELAQLAKSLDYNPVKIYDYVYKNIDYNAGYFGSLRGGYGAYLSKSGNDYDQASLLIALLRASNIPARYVFGNIEVTDAQPMGAEGRANRWLGVKDYAAAAAVNDAGGLVNLVKNASAQNVGISQYHVWVEACMPYASYRGARLTNRGHRWLPLDPSFKDKTYQAGIAHGVTFDLAGYLSKRVNGPDSLPHETYLKNIESAVRASKPGSGLSDVPYKGRIASQAFDILPATLPYKVSNFISFGAGTEAATIPDGVRDTFKVVVKNAAGTTLAEKSMITAEALFKRLTVSFKGLDTTHQGRIDTWRNAGTMDAPEPTCGSTSVIPSIKADGVELIAGNTATPVDFCAKDVRLDMHVSLPAASCQINGATTSEGCVNTVTFKGIEAANLYALMAAGGQASDAYLQKRIARLLASIKASGSTPNAAAYLEDVEGEFLNIVAQKYGRYVRDGVDRTAAVTSAVTIQSVQLGVATAKAKIAYVFDQPFAITRKGFLIDVPGNKYSIRDAVTGNSRMDLFFLASRSASALESYIWQENAKTDAVSTIRGLQFANETGNTVLTLNSANWAAQNANLNYSAAEKTTLQNEVNAGSTVTVPKTRITYENWTGMIYMAENESKGYGGYIISGGYNGGYSLSNPINYSYNPLLNTGLQYIAPPPAPISFNSIVQNYAPPAAVNSSVNYGGSSGNTYSGDPVNMVTGNMYHNETDIDLAVRGGQRIVLQRAYNSRKGVDGPFGFGWTHSLNHFLTFRDDNINGAADAADTDSITSSVTWTDGTGGEKYVAVTAGASASGLATTSTFKTPDGQYFTLRKNADNTYTIVDKGGVTYTFEAVAGTKDQRANLTSIKDRNGNALTLNYDASKRLSTVTDGVRTLTFGYDGTSTRIRDVTDPLSRKHSYAYDAAGNLNKVWKPGLNAVSDTPSVTYSYFTTTDGPNLDHAMKRYTLARGNYMDFTYYPNGRVQSHVNASGESMSFSYNDFRRETVQVNERGLERRFFFDKNGMPLKVIEENMASREFVYGGADTADRFKLLEAVDARGARTKYEYDTSGNLLKTTYPSGRTEERSYYNTYGQPGKVKDARGVYSIAKFDANGNVLQALQMKKGYGATIDPTAYVPASNDPATQVAGWTQNTYDTYGNLLVSKRVRDMATQTGPSVEYGYEATNTFRNKLTRRGDKNGDGTIATDEVDTITLEPDAVGQIKKGVDNRWQQVSYDYDSQGRLISSTNAAGITQRIEYDANGNVKQEKLQNTVNGVVRQLQATAHEYDQSDRRTRTMANGLTVVFEYDPAGNVTTQTDPDGKSMGYVYDEMNRVVTAADKEGNRVVKSLDVDGRPLSVTDANGQTTTYTYWDASRDFRVKRITQPKAAVFTAGRAVEYDYDEVGNVTSTKVFPADGGAARETLSTFDEFGRQVRVVGPVLTDPVNGSIRRVTKYAYDNLGRLTRVDAGRTDATGTNAAADVVTTQASYAFDDFGRKLKDIDGAGRAWVYAYNTAGDVTTVTDPRNKATTQTWNADGTLRTRANEVGTITYTRDALGLVTKVANTNPAYTQDFTYNGQRRLESVRDSRGGKTLYYEYSPAGRLIAMRDNEGAETNYVYDPLGRLVGLWAANYDFVTFGYDKGGRLTERWWPNGVKSAYAYNEDGTLGSIRHEVAGVEKAKHTYAYDAWGNRKEHAENLAGTELKYGYEYDELNRLIKAQYTQVVNAVSTTTLLGQYRYDILNNRTRLTDKDGNYLQYVYDTVAGVPANTGAHQLNQIDLYNAAGVKQSTQATLGYDALGNLISKSAGTTSQSMGWDANNALRQVITQVSSTVNGVTTNTSYNEVFDYDHEGRRIARQMVTGSTLYQSMYLYNGPDIHKEYGVQWLSPVSAFTHGPGDDDPLIHQNGSGSRYYHADGLGSPTLLTDAAGNLQAYRRFDPWGRTIGSGGTLPVYGYTGREPDLSTGLTYYRARYYDASLGRFISRDPMGMSAGINVYAYVDNNPTNFTDPSGMLAKSITNTVSGLGSVASSYYDSASTYLSTRVSNTSEALINTAKYGFFKTNSEMDIWGAGLKSAQSQGSSEVANYLRQPGNLPGGYVKDLAAMGAGTLSRSLLGTSGSFAEGAASRGGLNNAGGYFNAPIRNGAGGEVHLSSGTIYQSDFGSIVNGALMQGNKVEILSGAHGLPSGMRVPDVSLLAEDLRKFGGVSGVTVHDITKMTDANISNLLNTSSGTVIGGFCNSFACLGGALK